MTKTTQAVARPITAKQYEAALERYAANKKASKTILDKSEQKVQDETKKRHLALGNMPQEMEQDEAVVKQYCVENRATLFGDSKSIETAYGVLSFRLGGYAVTVAEGKDEAGIIDAFKKKKLQLYVVGKETIDRKKLITDRDNAKLKKLLDGLGITISQGETFKIDVS